MSEQKNEKTYKEQKGLNYFDDIEVKISKKNASNDSSEITLKHS